MKQKIVCKKDLYGIHEMLYELDCLARWSEFTVGAGKFTELSKQALNSAITYFFAVEAKHEGANIDFTKFPKLSIMRALIKTVQCDIPELNFDIMFHIGNVSRLSFEQKIYEEEISKYIEKPFREFLKVDSNSLESRIYNGSRNIATYLELLSLEGFIPTVDFLQKKKQLEEALKSYSDLPGFQKMMSEEYLSIFRNYSQLRNRIRWAKHPNIVHHSVLGHCFDVGVFAYIMSLERDPEDLNTATSFFFMGNFHDFPERWTGDIPSPTKDAMNLRKASEEFENLVMSNNVYSKLPDYQVVALRHVMLEDPENASRKKILKPADNFAAYVECWRQIDAGSNHKYFIKVLHRDFWHTRNLPRFSRLLMGKLFFDELFRL